MLTALTTICARNGRWKTYGQGRVGLFQCGKFGNYASVEMTSEDEVDVILSKPCMCTSPSFRWSKNGDCQHIMNMEAWILPNDAIRALMAQGSERTWERLENNIWHLCRSAQSSTLRTEEMDHRNWFTIQWTRCGHDPCPDSNRTCKGVTKYHLAFVSKQTLPRSYVNIIKNKLIQDRIFSARNIMYGCQTEHERPLAFA